MRWVIDGWEGATQKPRRWVVEAEDQSAAAKLAREEGVGVISIQPADRAQETPAVARQLPPDEKPLALPFPFEEVPADKPLSEKERRQSRGFLRALMVYSATSAFALQAGGWGLMLYDRAHQDSLQLAATLLTAGFAAGVFAMMIWKMLYARSGGSL